MDREKLRNNIMQLSKEDRYKPNEYRVSELVYCPAKSFYYRKLNRKPLLNGRMLSGLMFHEKLPDIMKGLVEDPEFEVECSKVYRDYRIVGHADVVNSNKVWEFKYSASKLNGKLPLYYYLQANTYATLLDKQYYAVVFVNSYNLDVNIIEGKTDKKALKFLEDQAKYIHNSIKNNTVPKGPMYDWECKYCDLKDVCEHYKKSESDKTKELLKRLRI